MFGATSMLGKYIMEEFRQDHSLCLICYGRSKCKHCDIIIKGDLRDTRLVDRVLAFYKPDTVMTSVKPPLENTHYRVYIELNMLSMMELIKLAKHYTAKNFIYVSSIAAANHYLEHKMGKESDTAPYYTDYEAPYDMSKRVAEDFLLQQHVPGVFNAISLRTSGIIGGDGDPYDYMRLPVLLGFSPPPPPIDTNFAGNIAISLYHVWQQLPKQPHLGGQYYYYTGEHTVENDKMHVLAKHTGKYVVLAPMWLVEFLRDWGYWAKWDPHSYTFIDLVRMGTIEQTFDQTKFHTAFPNFKPKYTVEEALLQIYA